jgi:hypothetical protein
MQECANPRICVSNSVTLVKFDVIIIIENIGWSEITLVQELFVKSLQNDALA